MAALNRLFEETIVEIEETIDRHKQKVENEIGEYEHPALIVKGLGEQGKDRHKLERERQLLMFYEPKLAKIKRVREEIIDPDAEPLKQELDRTEEESSIYQKKDFEILMHYFNNYRNLLRQSIKLLNGEEYNSLLGDTEERKHPSLDTLEDMKSILERDKFHDLREKHVHKFLTASGVLRRLETSLEGYASVKEEDIKKSEEITESIESITEEFRKRAEDLDLMLLKASSTFEAGEKHKDNTERVNREEIPDNRSNTSHREG